MDDEPSCALYAVKFGVVWFGQAVWVWVTLLPVLILNGTQSTKGFRWSDVVGTVLWIIGFVCETTADLQKTAFKNKPENKGRFINTGGHHIVAQSACSARWLMNSSVWS